MNSRIWLALRRWIDNDVAETSSSADPGAIDWLRVSPFVLMHLGCAAVFVVGTTSTAVAIALVLYAVRMFSITAFYHRYFSHRAFRTSRTLQFVFALLGASAVQRGPLWWASHHRHHHVHSDDPADAHSAKQHGFLWSHLGWFLARASFRTRTELVPDLAVYPELRMLDRFDAIVPAVLAIGLYLIGETLAALQPDLGTDGAQLLVWGFCVSTVVLYHATFAINSLAHRYGSRRYATGDESRNSFWLALLTFGEGWHNNHHHFPGSARQGFRWYEIDLTYYVLRLLAALGMIHDLRPVPERMRNARLHRPKEQTT